MSAPVQAVIVIAHDERVQQTSIEHFGPEVAARVEAVGGDVLAIEAVPLGGELFEERLQHYIDDGVALVLTFGGCSIGPDDIVPELTSILVERRVPGIEELVRRAVAEDSPAGVLERGACGIAGGTLVANLPGDLHLAESALAALQPVLPVLHELLGDAGADDEPGESRRDEP